VRRQKSRETQGTNRKNNCDYEKERNWSERA
jgi:hypothetical protein